MTLFRALRAVGTATALVACAGSSALPPSSPSELYARPLPSFRRPTLGGDGFDTDADRGRVVVVKFFAKYCAPCQKSLPSVEALHRELPDVAFVGVSEDELEADARQQVERHRLTFPVVLDRDRVLAGRFRVNEMPVVFVADRTGRVAWVGGPETGDAELRRAIAALE